MARIAVVDDEVELRDRAADALRGRGFQVQCFATIGAAVGHLEAHPPDLLVTEAALRDGSGLDMIARLRDATARGFPVIVASSRRGEQDILRGYAAGACDYLLKPYACDELLAKVTVHLARRDQVSTVGPLELPTTAQLAFGRYRLGAPLGRGAGGIVYSALDPSDRRVALKVLTLFEDARAEARLRFLREVYALSSVRHPHVAGIVDFGASEGRLYYAMERVEGPTLFRKVMAEGRAGEAQALALVAGLASALEAMRRCDLVHRDVKPGNIILRGGRWDDPVLIDFGLAKRPFDRGLTGPDIWTGTPGYIPPEVILGHGHDHKGDLFSLGLVCRFALLGEEPFPAMRGLPLLYHMTREQVPVPAGASPDMRAFLDQLTALDPAERPATAADVARRVDALARRITRPRAA
ncbi:MAG: protein kinase [Planctomycetes bacterium]|nr:protein kinase [Planctomycetota bacterium]